VCPGGQEGQRQPGLDQQWGGQREQGRDRAPMLGTGEAAPRVLCPVLGPSLQEGHWGAGAWPEKGSEAGEGAGEQVPWGAAEAAGAVQAGEEEAEGETLLLSTTTWQEGAVRWVLVSAPN